MASLQQFPVLSSTPLLIISTSPPNPTGIQAPKKWTFSFQYWRQIEFFGFNRTTSEWFVSLLEKLRILSEEEYDKFICDSRKVDVWRYHHIDWGHKNTPYQLKDLTWIPSWYRNNEEEFELVQFQVSRALGRVIGFWDRDYIFNIVLLDPFHNMQPDKGHNYRVDPCNPLGSEYTNLLHGLDAILEEKCEKNSCEFAEHIRSIPTNRDALFDSNVLMVKLTDEDIEYSDILIQERKACSLNDIFKKGLKHLI